MTAHRAPRATSSAGLQMDASATIQVHIKVQGTIWCDDVSRTEYLELFWKHLYGSDSVHNYH